MDILEAIALGIIQGVTEWLPISSSGHLALAHHIFGTEVEVSFDIILHLGTLLAVIAYYRDDLIGMAKGILHREEKSIRLAALLFISAIPTAIIGLLFRDFFESMFSSMLHIAGALAITGIFLVFVSSRTLDPKRETQNPDTGHQGPKTIDAFLIGIAQGLAVAPGISRSGATIGTALLLGIKPKDAAEFSFLIGIPAMTIASVLTFLEEPAAGTGFAPLLVAIIAAFIAGYASIGLFMKWLQENKLYYF